MKKIFLAILAIMLCASISFAQSDTNMREPVKSVTEGVEAVGEFVGKVVSVTVAEPAKGVTDTTVKVSDEMGNPVSFTVNSAAKITDASLNVITLNQLKEGDEIKVKSVKTKEGKEEAKSIAVQ